MTTTYEFDDLDLKLIRELRSAIRDVDELGSPAKDCLDEDDMLDAVRLLLNVVGQDVAAGGGVDWHRVASASRGLKK